MGPKDKQPPFPEFEWTKLPRDHRYVTKFRLECNYLQAMEGDYDPSHARFLHSTLDANAGSSAAAHRLPARADDRGVGNRRDPDEPFPRAVGNRRVTTETRAKQSGRAASTTSGAMLSVQVAPSSRTARSRPASASTWWMPIFCTAGIALPGHLLAATCACRSTTSA